MKPLFVMPVLLLGASGLFAQPAEPEASRGVEQARARIAAEREHLKASLFEQEQACYQRFAVNDCLRKVRRQQREALAVLRQQEVKLNDEARQRQSAERLGRTAPAASAPASN